MIPDRLRWLTDAEGVPATLGRLFEAAGHELYLVGGSVRDAILGRDPADLDFATDARPEQAKQIVSGWADAIFTVGEAFGTIGARFDGVTHEITTFRLDIYREESRKPRVTYSDTIEEDLARRDFTVNAMAIKLPGAEIIDPHGGLADLARRLLRTPKDPHVSFSDDPLRMLRLFRFQATLGFEADGGAVAAVGEMAERLRIVSAERIRDEFSKLITAPAPGLALTDLAKSGLLDVFIPEFAELAMAQDPIHKHKDILSHTIAVTEKASPDLTLRLAALLHDIGKPQTRVFGSDGVTFHHHEVVGSRMARDRLREMRYSKEIVEDVRRLVFLHLRPHTFKMGWTDSAVRRYVRDAGPLLTRLNELVSCDVTTANERRARGIQAHLDELEVRIEELAKSEELNALRPPIDGHDVMAYLGIQPGRRVGEIMDALLEKRIEDGPYSREEAFWLVRELGLAAGLDDPGPSV